MGIPEGRESEVQEAYLIMTENFPSLGSVMDIQIYKTQSSSNRFIP